MFLLFIIDEGIETYHGARHAVFEHVNILAFGLELMCILCVVCIEATTADIKRIISFFLNYILRLFVCFICDEMSCVCSRGRLMADCLAKFTLRTSA